MLTDNASPRWRIRRVRRSAWEVRMRIAFDSSPFGYVYAPLGTWPTWDGAIGYIQRTHSNNYGRAA